MLRIISYNIRYNNPADGRNAWPYRQEKVAALLERYQPDLIGLQEVRHEQLESLAAALPHYDWIGVGRDDGVAAGEYAPIFYRRSRFALQQHGHFWLSATPEQPGSFGWDAACVRIATWVQLVDLTSNQPLLHLNTHLDHRGMTAQLASVDLLHRFLATQARAIPALITGDFNCTPDSATYRSLTGTTMADQPLIDLMHATLSPHEGPIATFTTDFTDPLEAKIDYIFLRVPTSAPQAVTVHRHATLTDQHDGYYPSDHLPVIAALTIDNAPLQ